jgi:adenylosuccinate synthase
MTEAWIVVDLGFGDSGKGTVVDFLVRERAVSLVVRFNGGAQAGHNVVTPDGRHHTFSQLGSGTFVPDVRTHLSSTVVVDPIALRMEAQRLREVGVTDALARLTIDPRALVITPYQRAINQLRERARGAAAHGTCGIGFGETVFDSLERPDLALRVSDLYRPAALPRKLRAIRTHARRKAADLGGHAEDVFANDEVVEGWVAALASVVGEVRCVPDEAVALGPAVVLEGAQGVLLDEWRGFHPHTTWSTCTTENAISFLRRRGVNGALRIGVTRTYATRHGAGPLPTEARLGHPEPHNGAGGWQGAFRQGHLDLVLLRYALEVCPVDALALTHVDRPPEAVCTRYREASRLVPSPGRDLDYQAELTGRLFRARPMLEAVRGPVSEMLRAALRVPVAIESRGLTCQDKRWTSSDLRSLVATAARRGVESARRSGLPRGPAPRCRLGQGPADKRRSNRAASRRSRSSPRCCRSR